MANPWWVWYNVQSGQPAQVIEEPSAAAVKAKTGFPPLGGPFPTKAAAEKWLQTSGTGKKTTPTPVALPGPLSGLNAIGNFANKLGEANTWLRVGEVLLGIILLGIGAARITGAQNAISSVVKARIP